MQPTVTVEPMSDISLPVLPTAAGSSSSPMLESGPRSISAVRMLRISLTDRCNYRCVYCMPADGVPWLPADRLLSFDQIVDVARAAVEIHGITSIKLTGGEPTLRAGLPDLVARLRKISDSLDLSLTTNGSRLAALAGPLKQAGLDRVTISLDTLQPDRFTQITRTGRLDEVWAGIDACQQVGLMPVKLNIVAMRGFNDDEVADFARLTIDRPITVRFIEYMPLGDSAVLAGGLTFDAHESADGHTSFSPRLAGVPSLVDQARHADLQSADMAFSPAASSCATTIAEEETGPAGGCGAQDRGNVFISQGEIQSAIESSLGPLEPVDRSSEAGVGPAQVYRLSRPDALGRIGFISAMSQPFCSTCNRLRLTATGVLRSCLFDGGEVDLTSILAGGTLTHRQQDIADAMTRCVTLKPVVHSVHGQTPMSRIGG